MPELGEHYRKDPSIISREIAGEVILVPIRSHVGDLESIYTLNETGARIWALLDEQHTLGEIINQIQAEYEISAAEASQDLFELVTQLQQINAIVKA